jgi:nitrite reductase/ring-hydroxylating ferredoxin subunit
MESHGGNVELIGLEDGVARLKLQGSCNGCAASRATLELAIKQALEEHAPDLVGLEVQGVTESAPPDAIGTSLPMAAAAPSGAFELPIVHSGSPGLDSSPASAARWVGLEPSRRPAAGAVRQLEVDGVDLLLADVDGTLLAYIDECASCGATLSDGNLRGGMLCCAQCGTDFDLPRAGRAAGGEPLQLRPVPLLEAGGLRVAV